MGDPVSLVVRPIVDNVIGIGASLIREEACLVLGMKKDVEKLSSKLTCIKAVLEDAEERQMGDRHLRDWLGKLRNAAYDAEDILETFATEAALSKRKQQQRKIPAPLSASKISYQSKAAHKIKEISARLDIIAEEKEKFHLKVDVKNNGRPQTQNRSHTGASVDTAGVFGRDGDKEKLINLLLSNEFDKEGDISVIPIIGMAGLGKTTLAQLLFDEERVKNHFESRMWVCVTTDFDLKRILKEMIEFHSKMKYGTNFSISLLESRLLEFLAELRFLLVIDDVWTENYGEWKPLQDLLKQGKKGSRVLVTSRNARVANIMGVQSPYLLEYLPEDECWSIFKKITFNHNNFPSGLRENLEGVGREIVRKCKGLPLAVRAMAGLLRKYDDINKWERILNSNMWELDKEGSSNTDKPNILPALKLSYDHLPPYLKHCFSYCSIFPKAYVFHKEELVKYWIAEAFIQPRGQEREEEIGIDYFDELLVRSFFQLTNIHNKVRYRMHDLTHDLAQSISSPYICHVNDNKSCNISEETRHVSLLCKDIEQPALSVVANSEKLRTLLFPGEHLKNFGRALDRIFHKLKYLRLLDLSSSSPSVLPDSVGELKLLRYLDLSRTEIKVLPNSICKLYNLLTLKLIGCLWLMELPKDLTKLVNLRNLELDDMFWYKFPQLPPRIGQLTNLHNLHAFRVDCKTGYGIEELNEMAYLMGTLHISKLEHAVNREKAKLNDKKKLQKVVFEWSRDRVNPPDLSDEEKLLKDLQPHPNLKELQIISYLGISLPHWMRNGRLQNLVNLTLKCCSNCRILSLGHLPCLRELYIKGMLELEKWPKDEQSNFLGRLKISNCPNLYELPRLLPRLGVMQIKKCCSLRALPVTPSLEFLSLFDNLSLESCKEEIVALIRINDAGQQSEPWHRPSYIDLLEMKLVNCPKLQALPEIFAPQKLEISGCELLSTLPYSEFSQRLQLLALDNCLDGTLVRAIPETNSLNFMTISNISSLYSFPRWPNLPGLKSLYISCCQDLVSISAEGSLKSLNSLVLLSIRGCSKLENLPDEGLPTSLKCLVIASCSSLKSLGTKGTLKSLNSLKDLYIEDCPQLKSLPEDGLPENIQHLVIQNCDLLTQQCRKEDGEGPEWPKIKDIPDREIDFKKHTMLPKKKASPPAWYCPFVCSGGFKGKEKMEPGEPSTSAGHSP